MPVRFDARVEKPRSPRTSRGDKVTFKKFVGFRPLSEWVGRKPADVHLLERYLSGRGRRATASGSGGNGA